LHFFFRREIARPLPDGDGQMNAVVLRRNAQRIRAAPGDRAHIGILETLLLEQFAAGIVDFFDAERNLETENAGGLMQAFGMLSELEYLAAIGALAFKHGACIMQAMGQHMDFCILPVDEFSVQPDESVPLIEWNRSHFLAP